MKLAGFGSRPIISRTFEDVERDEADAILAAIAYDLEHGQPVSAFDQTKSAVYHDPERSGRRGISNRLTASADFAKMTNQSKEEKTTMKVSEWLKEHTDSHLIQDAVKLQNSYEKETGNSDLLPTHTVADTRAAIVERGLGGWCEGEPDDLVCSGYVVAEFLADLYGDNQYRAFMGRGFRYRAAIRSIKEKGN